MPQRWFPHSMQVLGKPSVDHWIGEPPPCFSMDFVRRRLEMNHEAAILQGRQSNYDTDLFTPLLHRVAEIARVTYGSSEETDTSMRVIAVSQHEAAHLAALGVPVDRISVIPNGVDLGELDGLKGQRKGDRLRGIFVGRLDPDQKGLTTLFQALALLPSDLPLGVRLIGEDWGATEILRSLAERLGIRDKVAFVGRVDRGVLVNEYRDADFLVLPSLFEPFGIVLLEAMATGLPVVASRVGGIPEIVEQGRTGILVEPGNARALADALTEICHDENLRIAMGAEARVRAAAFDWKTITPRILSVYHQAMEER